MKAKTILVTGGSGLIGSQAVRKFCARAPWAYFENPLLQKGHTYKY